MLNRRHATLGLLATLGLRPAFAQSSFPGGRPIRIIVPFAAGGSSDVMARGLGKQLSDQMGVPFVIENRPGAGGGVAMEQVARAPADGHTLLYGTIGTNAVAPVLFKNLPVDPAKDLAPVSLAALNPSVLVVHSSLPVNSLRDLIAYAKANPGKLNYASAGNGSISHLATELLKSSAGIDMVHVPYKGGGAASADLLAGNVSLMIETITNAMTLVKTGKVRAIANSGSKRSPSAPDLPTFAEAGLPSFVVDSWTGIFTASGTPTPVIERLSSEIAKASREPAYRQSMSNIGVEAASSSPSEFANFVRAEQAKWGKVVQATGTRIE
ncbi:tripartite tricarboxylate transporter substrate binding protein [Ramlibacter sp. AW1]|uniref:Tripartite tricarboxylate transporter substrate binding protein n=1 Tax=Ramlibacter aurantiacus TaxID=2801330 RepID=A0A936ZQM0_9BURK|nr:tripartite tricarboxylate transporter substrate binding protein [Ramlibacter aurantiacus]MBL0421795.1 tripartite tricarboxylate transporter substrate binding protein [Ramlibacter aurantiacus]